MKKMFVARDSKAEAFGEPFFASATGIAIRSFSDEANGRGGQRSAVAAHPEDFFLYEIGTYDESSGTVELYKDKKHLGCASDFLDKEVSPVSMMKSS
jgi:hypothetical protein